MRRVGAVVVGEHRRPPTSHRDIGQWHFIVKWDEKAKRYFCDCGHPSETATDHEIHVSEEQRKPAATIVPGPHNEPEPVNARAADDIWWAELAGNRGNGRIGKEGRLPTKRPSA